MTAPHQCYIVSEKILKCYESECSKEWRQGHIGSMARKKPIDCSTTTAQATSAEQVLVRLERLANLLPPIPNYAVCDKEALLYIPACTVNLMNKIIGDWMKEELRQE